MIISWVVTTRQRLQEDNPQPEAHTHKALVWLSRATGEAQPGSPDLLSRSWFPTEVPTDVEMDFQMYPVSLRTSHYSHSEDWGKTSIISRLLASVDFQFCVLTGPGLSLIALHLTAHARLHSFLLKYQRCLLSTHFGDYFAYSRRNSFLFCFKCRNRNTSQHFRKKAPLLSDTALGNTVPAHSLHWPSTESGQDMSTTQEKQQKVHTWQTASTGTLIKELSFHRQAWNILFGFFSLITVISRL